MSGRNQESKNIRRTLDSYQPSDPKEFYFDPEGRVLDEFQNKVRGSCVAVWACMLGNELWNILNSDEYILDQLVKKFKAPDSVLKKLVNEGRFKDIELAEALIAEKGIMEHYGIKADNKDKEFKKRFPKFCNKLIDAGILYTPEEIMATKEKEFQDYKQSRRDYILGRVVTEKEKGKKCYRYGWNEAHSLVEQKIEVLEKALDKITAGFENYAKAADKGGIDARATAKKSHLNDRKKEFEKTLDEYTKWNGLLDSIENYRDLKAGFDKNLWNDLIKENPKKRFDGKTYETLPPEQVILEHPLTKFTNNIEDKTLPLENRSGITIRDPGVKNHVRFAEKVNVNCDGDSSKIFDAVRLTFCMEKATGEGFLMQQLKKFFSDNKMHPRYERLKLTKSFYASSKFNGLITMEPAEIAASTGFKVSKRQSRVFEAKFVEGNQFEIKPEIDLTYRAIRSMGAKGDNEIDELIDAENSNNFKQVEMVRKKIEKVLKNRNVKEAMNEARVPLKLPEKETFRNNFIFEITRDQLRHLEKQISIHAARNADFSFKLKYYDYMVHSMNNKDITLYRKAFSREEISGVERILQEREKEKAKYTSNKNRLTR